MKTMFPLIVPVSANVGEPTAVLDECRRLVHPDVGDRSEDDRRQRIRVIDPYAAESRMARRLALVWES
jgi:hypothetical protein